MLRYGRFSSRGPTSTRALAELGLLGLRSPPFDLEDVSGRLAEIRKALASAPARNLWLYRQERRWPNAYIALVSAPGTTDGPRRLRRRTARYSSYLSCMTLAR